MKLKDINITKKQFEKIKKWGIISILVLFAITKTPEFFKEKGSIEDIKLYNLSDESTVEENESNSLVNNKTNNKDKSNSTNGNSKANSTSESIDEETINTKININTATSEQLQELYRIGPSMAQKIIDYRTQYGEFTCIEEILEVNGIGDATYAKIKEYISVD